jgi:hypothetical protein
MYIVLLPDNTRHSAWDDAYQAVEQIRVLWNEGYNGCSISYDETVRCENGHYYV